MPTFLERYHRGDRERVWSELVSLGGEVRTHALFDDARGVARETMRRAKENVATLISRLQTIGYAFAYQPDPQNRRGSWWGDSFPIHEPPLADVHERLDELERMLGTMPISLRAWYETVGAVNFIGRHPDWPDLEVMDPLVVCPLADMYPLLKDEYEDRKKDEVEGRLRGMNWPFGIDIAPDNWHKACISGGPAYRVSFPSQAADSPLFHEWHNTTFVSYIRTCFTWSGFPGFERLDESERPREHLKYLTEGLLPL